jgi:hypothetical protein
MSKRNAHTWKTGPLPSQTKAPLHWRNREDVFADVWKAEIVGMLERDAQGVLEATTIIAQLLRNRGDRFDSRHLIALHGLFAIGGLCMAPSAKSTSNNRLCPGRKVAVNFTGCTSLDIRIAGQILAHLLFQFILTFNK